EEMIQVPVDEHVANIDARADGAQLKSGRQVGRQVLEAVHSEVRLVPQKGLLDFLGEKSLGQLGFGQRRGLQLIAGGLDDLKIESLLRKRRAALGEDEVCLRQRQGAAPGGNSNR